MKRVGIVSYNMYGNFTNYGSALQTFALHKAIDSVAPGEVESIVVDYCPDVLADKDVLDPMRNMWDRNPEALERCRLSLPAIRENYRKFLDFYRTNYKISRGKYTSANFNLSRREENLDGYVCGSDTIFAVPEFGFDDGFYADYEAMRGASVAYAASFGDYDIPDGDKAELKRRLANFKAVALRERDKLALVSDLSTAPCYKVIDPTLLLEPADYAKIMTPTPYHRPYLLLYSRRGNERMQEFAERLAREKGWELVEISLNAQNALRHTMRYDAGVEEFLGLVKGAQMVVTNSFHGAIFAIQFRTPFYVFSRKLCDTKILELLELAGLEDRLITSEEPTVLTEIDFDRVHERIAAERSRSLKILSDEIDML